VSRFNGKPGLWGALVCVALAAVVAGCGGGEGGGNAGNGGSGKVDAPKGSGPKLVLVTNGSSDWWSAVEKGMKDGAAKFGADAVSKRNNDGSTEVQIRLLEEALASPDVKGVAVSVVESDAPGIADALRRLRDAGKMVITIDSDITPSAGDARKAYIGTNNTHAGEVAGKAAAQLRPQGGKVAVFVATASAANARERLEGFYAGAGAAFIKPPVEIFEDHTDMNQAQTLVETAIQKHPDAGVLLGLYSYNAPRIATEAAKAPEFRKKATIVTFDLDEQAVEHLEKGNIDVSVCQNPYEIGYQAVRLLKAFIEDDKTTLEEMLPKGATTLETKVRVIVPSENSPIKGDNVITIKAMKEWLATKGLKSS
jgi:ribose transport system substrate-binding protein